MEAPVTPRIRVYVVEDQSKILKNQLKLLEASAELEIIGTALSGETAIEDIRRLKPDVVLLDLGLPRMSGIDVTRVVKGELPSTEVLIFTIFDEEDKVLEAVQAGASGYLLKGTPADKMVEAIREVSQGGTVIQPSLARRLLKHFRVPEGPAAEPSPAPATPAGAALPAEPEGKKLSARETEILQLIAKGVSNNEAATMLNLSKATIRTHLEHIYRKLEVTNRVEAVTEGLRKGIIQM
ncbi:MAG: response regulator transcription factor [Myxococcaceae bacterium]|jgi:DNA-binding NarL/FixJ family response regulator|nr:response regulator transcription factor [Myxococcaceae bacterium]